MAKPALSPNAWLRWDIVRRHLSGGDPARRILEIGMGQGAVAARLSEMGRYTGIEPDAVSRCTALARLPSSARVLTTTDELAADERFDVICAFEVIEHIDDDVGAVGAWVEHLAVGGDLLLSVPAHAERFAAADRLAGHFRRYSRQQLAELVTTVGLEVVTIDATGFPLGFVLEHGRNSVAARRIDESRSIEEQTAASGRFLQPPSSVGPMTQAATLPFRLLQRPFRRGERGTGWVVIARRPPA